MKTIRLILLSSLLTTALVLCTQAREGFEQDSLESRLETLGHDTLRLNVLRKLSKINMASPEKAAYYANELFKEAELQHNDRYKVFAYLEKIIIAYNSYDVATTQTLYDKLAPVARKERMYDELFFAHRCAIDMQTLMRDYERSERDALQMLEEARKLGSKQGEIHAYASLAGIYRLTYRLDRAIEILEKACAIAKAGPHSNSLHNLYQTLNFLYESSGDSKNWLRILKLWEAFTRQHASPDDPSNLIIYTGYLKYYTRKGDWEQVERYRALGNKYYAQINSPLYRILYLHGTIDYLKRRNLLDQALIASSELVAETKLVSNGIDYYNSLWTQTILLYQLERLTEALPLFKEVIAFRDSSQIATINKQYEQLKKDFNTDQLLLEQAQLRHQMQLFTLGLLLLSLLFIGYFIFHLLRSRKFLQKAEREMREINAQMEHANQIKDRFLSNISTSIRLPLNTVVEGSLRLAEHQVENEAERQALSADIRHKASDLLKMINDILDLSRLEAGMMKFEITDVEVTSSLLDAIGVSPIIQHGVEIEPAFAMDTLYIVRMDSNRLLQVFKSLFLDKAPECSRIRVTTCELAPDKLEINVFGSIQACAEPRQDAIIRNEINRMLIHLFEGTYEINQSNAIPAIRITLPLAEIIRPEGDSEHGKKH